MRLISKCLAGASLIAASATLLAGSAFAGEEVLYGKAPGWAKVYDSKAIDITSKTPIVLYDVQQRIEDGTLTIYVDRAFKLDSPQTLTQAGTSSASWQPDKGDLTVHRVEILRGDKRIDLLADGAKYTVLRRETQLEQRTLDGALTATLAVPGLQLGDVLRISYSQTIHDPTLKGNVQMSNGLIAAPTEAVFARETVSWPKGETVRWQAGPGVIAAKEADVGGDHVVTIALPLAKPEEMPADSPLRYRRTPSIQAGTFADWQEVSRIFAPLYNPKGTIAPDSELAGEVARIVAQSEDPLTRAALATQLVQDKISYQMNGMATGNYVPQSPAQTWQLRYGDCKAKTLLLLSLLDAMGIESEAVLVNSKISDAVPDLLPIPSAFDHVLVKATIAGTEYWLDGTSTGTRLSNIADTPGFRNGLPLRAQGAELMAIAPRVPQTPQVAVALTFDQRGGVDLPTLVTAKATMSGVLGATLGAVIGQASKEQTDEIIDRFAERAIANLVVTGGSLSYDPATSSARIVVEGIQTSDWTRQGARMRESFDDLPSDDVAFSPDRARPAWKDVPVDTGIASFQDTSLTVLLPEDEEGYLLRGRTDLDMTYANTRFVRSAKLDGHTLQVDERVEALGGEVAADAIAAEKGKAARIANSAVFLLAPVDAVRQWQVRMPQYQARIAPYEAAYAKAIERKPDEGQSYTNRGRFRWSTADLEGALADYDKAIELDPSPANYRSRGYILTSLGEFDKALVAYRRAFELDPSADSAMALAEGLGRTGKTEEALALIDEYDDYGEQHANYVNIRADALGYGGQAEEGLEQIDALIEERPGQGSLYNSSCWYRARFKVGMDQLMATCDKAVEQSGMAAASLDSRALAWLQLGKPEKALADANAALALVPDLTSSLYFRAVAQRRLGDDSGKAFIRYMDSKWPGQAQDYKVYGLEP